MTIENFFVKKYEKLEAERNELEKKKRALEIDLERERKKLSDVAEILNCGYPKLTSGGYLSISVFYQPNEEELRLLKKIGVKIEGEQE